MGDGGTGLAEVLSGLDGFGVLPVIETPADVVLMGDDLTALPYAVRLAQRARRVGLGEGHRADDSPAVGHEQRGRGALAGDVGDEQAEAGRHTG